MSSINKRPAGNPFQFDLGWLLAYLTVMAAISAGLAYGRRQALATYGTPQAKIEWEDWKSDATNMAQGSGPVSRRAPQSLEPPALVLMRDYFAACLVLAIVLSTVLFGTFMFFLRGALQSRSLTPSAISPGSRSSSTSGPDGVGGLR
jgi:hypothetical protein